MKVKVLLLTFLLALEVVRAMPQHNRIVRESKTYHCNRCTKNKNDCRNQNPIDNSSGNGNRRRKKRMDGDTPDTMCFECQEIPIDTTSSSMPSCPIVTPTKCSSSATDASTNSVRTTAQQGIQKAMDSPIPTVTSGTSTKPMCSGLATKESITQAALGATVGLLSVLLILAIIGWVCTCVILKKKDTMNIDKTNNRYVKCHTYMTGVLHVYLLGQYTIMIFAIFDYSM